MHKGVSAIINHLWRGKIRNTLLAGMVVLTVIPALLALTIYYHQSIKSLEKTTYQNLNTVLKKQEYFINNWLWQQLQYAAAVSSGEQLGSENIEDISRYLQDISYTNPIVQDMGFVDKDGRVITATGYIDGVNLSDREYFQRALKGTTCMSDVVYHRLKGNPVIVFTSPVLCNYEIVGVFYTTVSIESISNIMVDFRVNEHTESYLINADGRMITRSIYHSQLVNEGKIYDATLGIKVGTMAAKKALSGESGVGRYTSYMGNEVYGAYKSLPMGNMAIIVERDSQSLLAAESKRVMVSFLNTAVIIFIVFVPVALLLSQRLARPLEDLADAARRLAKGDLGTTVNISANKEINQLASAFNYMSYRIQSMHRELNKHILSLEEQKEEIQCQNEELIASQEEIMNTNRKLERIATTDYLTNVYNRRYLFEQMKQHISRACLENIPVAIILYDVDHFKKINDKYGHQVGDQVLIELTRLMESIVGERGLLARFGGEEFVVMISDCTLEQARDIAEAMRQAAENYIFQTDGGEIRLTVSFGVTCFTGNYCNTNKTDLDRLLNVADSMLYQAKNSGRNRVMAILPDNL